MEIKFTYLIQPFANIIHKQDTTFIHDLIYSNT